MKLLPRSRKHLSPMARISKGRHLSLCNKISGIKLIYRTGLREDSCSVNGMTPGSTPLKSLQVLWHGDLSPAAQEKWIPVAWRLKMKLKGANTRLALINCTIPNKGLAFMCTDFSIIGFVKADSALRKWRFTGSLGGSGSVRLQVRS